MYFTSIFHEYNPFQCRQLFALTFKLHNFCACKCIDIKVQLKNIELFLLNDQDAKFKKVKKKVRKIRKKEKGVKADDLLAMDSSDPNSDFGSR